MLNDDPINEHRAKKNKILITFCCIILLISLPQLASPGVILFRLRLFRNSKLQRSMLFLPGFGAPAPTSYIVAYTPGII
jgi:hypothetical protein